MIHQRLAEQMKNSSARPNRRWPAFVAGAGAVLLILGIVALYREYDSIGKPQVLRDGDARVRFLERGVRVPDSAHDLYYFYLEGFTNYREYLSLSAEPSEARAVAQACAQRVITAPKFTKGTKSGEWFVNGGPGHDHSKWGTPLWDLTTVKNGEMIETEQVFVLVDTDKNRVYISTWGDFRQSEKFPFGIPRLSSGMAWYLRQCLEKK